MYKLSALLLVLLLAGCSISAPQNAQYKKEYSARQDIRKQSLYQFMTKPVAAGGGRYWGSGDLAALFSVMDKQATSLELRFNYPAKSLEVSSRDAQNKTLRSKAFRLLDESAAKPADADNGYFYLTKDGQLVKNTRNCTPDMSVGCRWWNTKIFITGNGNLAVQHEEGGAGMMFLMIPVYGSNANFEVFPKAPPSIK
ncbi:hypothetical protein [Ewingella americana]|uniref:hypothetical protein n=1 Tax=Ewingella americana TaxID=41202 RepID=UPI00163A485F|nr:hypothetical protein [Ewingella americana]QMV51187.1 hypothetical protein GXP68_07295 [Ewingella americana]